LKTTEEVPEVKLTENEQKPFDNVRESVEFGPNGEVIFTEGQLAKLRAAIQSIFNKKT
jgi:hypothetical protein